MTGQAMHIKHPKPIERTAKTFDDVDYFDVRFRRQDGQWKFMIRYNLIAADGEIMTGFEDKSFEEVDKEVLKLDKFITKVLRGVK